MVPTTPPRTGSQAPAARIEARGVVKRFGGVTALDGVDLALGDGEIVGLIGPNGSGKTTLVNCLSGVLPIDAGEVVLDGNPIAHRSRARRARAGLARTFQNLRLFRDLTVRENVLAGCTCADAGRGGARDVDALLARLRLRDLAREVVSALPYGHQRRVEIARALAGRPRVLLLDEPAAGLNDAETGELRALLAEIRDGEDCSIVLIDHDMNLVLEVSDRVQVLDEGRVIYSGAPKEAFKQQQVVEAYLGLA
jgi:ABC-type branched-subunit amino acid transport system ATPase component